jgi:alpha-L-rhamnosidase
MSIIRGPIELRCEHRHNPVGITEKSPRLSWRLEDERQGACQRSWEIEAASSYRKLVDGQADLWRSGRKPEDRSIDIVWDGEPLGSRC